MIKPNCLFSECEIVNHDMPQGTLLGTISPLIQTQPKMYSNSQMMQVLSVVDRKVAYIEKSRKYYKKQKNM